MDLMTWRMVGKSGKSPYWSSSRKMIQGAFPADPRFAPALHVLLNIAKRLSYSFHRRSFLIYRPGSLLFRFLPLPIFGHIQVFMSRYPFFVDFDQHSTNEAIHRFPIWKDADCPFSTANVFVQPFHPIGRAQVTPITVRIAQYSVASSRICKAFGAHLSIWPALCFNNSRVVCLLGA